MTFIGRLFYPPVYCILDSVTETPLLDMDP